MPHEIRESHENYKTMVSNVRRRFHGTHCSSICGFYVGVSRIHNRQDRDMSACQQF